MTSAQQAQREALAARMARPADPHGGARQALADDPRLAARLAAAIKDGLPAIDLTDTPRHQHAYTVWEAVQAHETARDGGPCTACGTKAARPPKTGFLQRDDTIEGELIAVSLCDICCQYVSRYGNLTAYCVAVLRAVAGYGTGVPVYGLPPRAKLASETTGGNGQPWSHVDVSEAVAACDRWYGHSRRDVRAEQATLRGITPHRWEATAGPATPQQAHVFTDAELRDKFAGRLGPDPATERRAKDQAKAKRDKARRQAQGVANLQRSAPRQ
jgi:hypothetical protein